MYYRNRLSFMFLFCCAALLLGLTFGWMPTQLSAAVTTYTNSTSAAIPDAVGGNCNTNTSNGVVTSTITISDSYTIADVNVGLNISHTWVSDLIVQLTSPAGTTITLVDRVWRVTNCGSSADNIITTLDDESGGGSVENGNPPTGASYTPQQALSAFDGQNLNGTWTLTVIDASTDDTGTLNSWSLRIDDGALPASFSVADVSGAENSGNLTFTVTRSGNTTGANTIDYATSNGSATAGSDYTAANGTLTFSPGDITQTMTVTLTDDLSYEGNETFNVNLSNVAGNNTPVIADNQGVGTITDDEGPASFSIDDMSGAENSSSVTFTVTRSGNTNGANTIDFASSDSSATAGSDYSAASGTLTFNTGDVTQTIVVTLTDDSVYEGDETFTLDLSNVTGDNIPVIADNQGLGTIVEDETVPGLSVNDVQVRENRASSEFTVTLNPPDAGTVTVDYTITDGTAKSGRDYTVVSATGTLTFAPGETSQTIPFAIIDNTKLNSNRQFTVTLSNSSGPTIADDTGVATIKDNEKPVVQTVELPAPPPAPPCTDINFEPNGVMRSNFTNDIDRPNAYCRLIVENSTYMTWFGGPLTNAGNIGSQTVLDLGVLQAVDVFSPAGATGFVGDVNICLKGSGYMIYLGVNGAPRIPQLWSTWTTPSFPGYTCTTLYAPGTVVLVASLPE